MESSGERDTFQLGRVIVPRRSRVKVKGQVRRAALLWVVLCGLWSGGVRSAAQTVASANSPQSALTGDILQSISEMNFEVMTMKQGLPHDSVYGFAQDNEGYVWVASFGGLSRFDGYQFYNYTHDPALPGSLPDNNVRVLLPREGGGLYVGTGSAGMSIYDPASDSFTIPVKTPPSLRKARVFCMASDGEGGVWVGMQTGFAHFHAKTGEFDLYGAPAGQQAKNGLPSGGVFSLLQDRQNNLWVGTENGLYLRSAGSQTFHLVPGESGLPQRPSVWSIFQDQAGEIWVGTDTNGLGKVSHETHQLQGYAGLSGENSLIGAHTIRGFLEIQPGVLWFITYGSGLFSLDTHTGKIRHWPKDPTASAPLSNDFIRGILQDRSGVVWFGTDSGLSTTVVHGRGIFNIRSSPLRPDRLFGSEVRSVGAGYGRAWVGFDQGGFAEIDRDGSIHRVLPAPGLRKDQVSYREVLAIKPLDEKTVVAGGIGLYLIDVPSRTYRPVEDPFVRKQIMNAVMADGDLVWAGCYNGLIRYNRRTREVKVFAHQASNPQSIADDYVRDMLKDSKGRFWVTTRLGLDLFDPEQGTFRHFRHDPKDPTSLASDNVQPLAEDAAGRIWVGSIGEGVQVLEGFTPEGKPHFRQVNHDNDGLPDDVILIIRKGKDGVMWINTPRGLASVSPQDFTVQRYGEPDGLQVTAQNLFSSGILDDGTILFPGSSSLVIIRPEKLHRWTVAAPLVLTEVEAQGLQQSPVLLARKTLAGQLEFPAHSGFELSFSLLDYTAPADTLYSYQLEGFDNNWSSPSNTRRTANYTNLPGGDYTFHVRAVSRNGSGPTQEIEVPIHLHKGITETFWFQVFLTLGCTGVVLLIIRARLAYMARRQHELERLVATRTAELVQSRQQLLEANDRLAKLALHDPLTGTLNRRGFFERAELELARSARSGRSYSLLLADLDNFKLTNDTLGHSAGDAALRAVASLLAGSIRTSDILARYGGEEFILFLPETDAAQALLLAERLRSLIQELPIDYAGQRFHTTTSIGLVTSPREPENLEAMIAQADHALYQAKRAGKNCVKATNQSGNSH